MHPTDVRPFVGLRFHTRGADFGDLLAPPYDVISPELRETLYALSPHNIVRIDCGRDHPGDAGGGGDRYARAAGKLTSWLEAGILNRDPRAGFTVTAHEFLASDGSAQRRLGLFGTVAARAWETSDLLPHECTLGAPKQDRLRLMQTTQTQTSAVFCLWAGARLLETLLAEIAGTEPQQAGCTEGEFGAERHLVWYVDDAPRVEMIHDALRPAKLYVADGHHRYETAVTYAGQRRAAEPEAPAGRAFERCLVYLCSADDPGLTVLPTHRLVRPRPGMPRSLAELAASVTDSAEVIEVNSLDDASRIARLRHTTHHAFGIALADGTAVLLQHRAVTDTPRNSLDATVLAKVLLRPLGIDDTAVAEGALDYTRSVAGVAEQVASGRAVLGATLNPVTVAEVMAVADAGEVMPQKSTYFYPKVPTGIVLAPL